MVNSNSRTTGRCSQLSVHALHRIQVADVASSRDVIGRCQATADAAAGPGAAPSSSASLRGDVSRDVTVGGQ